jgi:hypothetical protein
VECSTGGIFFRFVERETTRHAVAWALSSVASLDCSRCAHTIRPLPKNISSTSIVNTSVHRFEESIAGHPYLIEVAFVGDDRWRAYIVRIPGVPTALMPFYGSTPDEAASLLRDWLTRAHERASKPGPAANSTTRLPLPQRSPARLTQALPVAKAADRFRRV